jgi:hypothetical protein
VDLLVARLNRSSVSAATEATSESAWDGDGGTVALQDIAGTHREEQTLYEIAQALGSSLGVPDAMALIQDKVSRLVPFVTCALFLGDDNDGYVCRYAHGPGTEALTSRSGCRRTPTAGGPMARSSRRCCPAR